MSERVYNFSAGPAVLPLAVLKQVQAEMLSLPDVGMSILEISHRSEAFEKILADAETQLRQLLTIPSNYRVLFLQGGASLQFSMIPLNFMQHQADYILSGSWAEKAIQEAQREGQVKLVWSGQNTGYQRMPTPDELLFNPEADYVHMTANETIEGIAFPYTPDTGSLPLICDASSNILSGPLEISKYAMIYAGAQKNMGPAGVTCVIISDEFLAHAKGKLHTMLDYQIMAAKQSLYNTPPVFSIYVLGLVAQWLAAQGGLAAAAERNQAKAQLIYDILDHSSGFYQGHAEPKSRSLMNITFRLNNPALEPTFLAEAEKQHLMGLQGHRSVGGIRASLYNAFPLEGAQALAGFMQDFQARYGS